jgi:chaperonin GroEL
LTFSGPRILTVDATLKTVKQISFLLDGLKKASQPVIIFCRDISDDAMTEVIYNVKRETIKVSVVTLHGSNDIISAMMEDLSVLFDSKLFNEINSDELSSINIGDLGSASKVDMTAMETFFITKEDKTESHRQKIADRLRTAEFEYRTASGTKKQLLEDRVTRLSGNMALIKIGGNSESEQHETKDKLTDGLNAVRNVLEYGALPGGGASLVHASKILEFVPKEKEEDLNNGVQLLREVLREPMKFIINNAGLNGLYHIENLLEKYDDPWIGFDVRKEAYGDMQVLGVIDSYHNLKNILLDAISIGSMLLTTECVVHRVKRYTRRLFL